MQEKTIIDMTSVQNMMDNVGGELKQPILMVLHGGQLKGPYSIDRGEMVVGRDAQCDIPLADTKVSRRHAQLTYSNVDQPTKVPQVKIKDLGSTNGTFVNGIDLKEEIELQDHDKIMIGSTLFGFFLRDESTIKAEQRLVELATSDSLTNLKNRVVFDMEIQREFALARRHNRLLSLMLFDIDHFKNINDTYGHPVGDAVLRELGKIVTATSRINDLTARYGGEEFAIILPETPIDSALIYAERLRKIIEENEFLSDEHIIEVRVSIGVATITDDTASAADLIKASDEALYVAKQSGRNQVCRHGAQPAGL